TEAFNTESVNRIREITTSNRINAVFGPQFQTDLSESVAVWSKSVGDAVRLSVDKAKADAFSLDVALTKDELANVSANAVSRIKLSVGMSNIELIRTEDESGQKVFKPIVS